MMRRVRGLAGLLAAAALAACATTPRPIPPPRPISHPVRPPPAPSLPPPPSPAPAPSPPLIAWSELPGWDREDHLAAMAALTAACRASRDEAMARVCAIARSVAPSDETEARAFLEANFRPSPVPGDGLLTAYFAPRYEAREAPEPPFTAPVRPKPGALDAVIAAALADPGPDSASPSLDDPLASPSPSSVVAPPGPDRAAIEAEPANDALAWMRPEDLFFLQIQGSGVLLLPDGRRMRATFAASNNQPFVGLARVMRQEGLIDDAHSSGEAIRAWLAAHRGEEADALMRRDPRYIYFKVIPDDGREPAGAAGVPLPAGRALAVDASRHSMGELFWIDGEAPQLNGAFPVYRRLAAALDVGGAIKGDVRADLYIGSGDEAGREAGRVRHVLHMYRLEPAPADNPLAIR